MKAKYWNYGNKVLTEVIFVPEFHGREHLNVAKWMNALQQGHEATRYAFNKKVYGIVLNRNENENDSYLAAYDYNVPRKLMS